MAVAHPGGHIDRLPDELVLQIIEQDILSVPDLISLARTSQRYYNIAIDVAYKLHVEDEYGLAIYWAIENEQHETLKRIVENGVDVNMLEGYDCECCCPIAFSIDWFFRITHLNKTKAFVKIPFGAQFTPLAWAAKHGRDSAVNYLLDHGADIELRSVRLCDCCDNLLHCAEHWQLPEPPEICKRTLKEEEEKFLEEDYHRDFEEHVPEWTPLHYAMCNLNESTAELLLDRGANASKVGSHAVTALHIATRWEMEETIDYLLDRESVDINAQNYEGVTALHLAHATRDYDLVQKFLDHGADINLEYSDETGPWTIIAMACADSRFDIALRYLRDGADPHFVVDGWGDNPEEQWSVMRLIYGYREDGLNYLYPPEKMSERIELEQAIMEVIKGKPSDK